MPQPTITVKDNLGANVTVFTINPNGQAAMADSQPVTIASDQPAIPTSINTQGTHYQPGYTVSSGSPDGTLLTDPDGNLVARAQVLTDEGGYRVNFSNSALAVSIGNATFTNGSTNVIGTGFLAVEIRTGDYCKLDADTEASFAQVAEVVSDTQITLTAPYAGVGGTGASSRVTVKPVTGSGGSISVASGVCSIASGTTNNARTGIIREVDWLPLVKQGVITVSQRIANQTIYIGFVDSDNVTAPRWFVRFKLDGAVNTTVTCESAKNPTTAPSASETETTTVTVPGGKTTAVALRYRIEVFSDRCAFYIDGVNVATHYRSLPSHGDLMTSVIEVINGTGAASTTTVTVDFDTVKNHNRLEVGIMSDTDSLVAASPLDVPYAYNVAGVIAINTDLMIIDMSQMKSVSLQCVSMGTTGVVTVYSTNDLAQIGTNQVFYPVGGGARATTFNAAGMWVIPKVGRYLRIRLTTATTAGTTTLAAIASNTAAPIQLEVVQGTGATLNVQTTGAAAQGSTASGNPVLVGAVAKTAQPTARSDGQVVAPLYSKVGHGIVQLGQVRDLVDLNAPVTISTTTETTVVAAVASTFNDVYEVMIANTSATGVRVDFRTVTAGAVVRSVWVPPTTTIWSELTVPWKQATVNTAWTAQLSAAVTDVRISLLTVRNI